MGMGSESSHQRYVIVIYKDPDPGLSIGFMEEFEEYKYLCDQIGYIYIYLGLNTLQIFWISLTSGIF